MIRRTMILVAAIVLGLAAPALAGQTAAEDWVAKMQTLVGKTASGDLIVTAVTAEDNVVVVTINARSGRFGVSATAIRDAFVGGMCKDRVTAQAFFKTARIRVDMLDRGENVLRGETADACPAETQG